ncbi:LuxR C-terminal-related transcriptional regulator [Corynebacterium anserum]|uniref:LuxR C-terminal-related transcriptional regulator n=1 Tax=Corynebacterium anserum TaxID=2684406 RepID=UPI0036F3ED46
MFRAGVRAELTSSGEGIVDVVGEAGSVAEAQAGIVASEPDVVLLDVHMPNGGGLAVLRRCRESQFGARFLCLSVSDSAEDVIALIRAGARGYVTKSISGTELVDAIVRVHCGDAVFSPRLAGYVLDAFSSGWSPSSSDATPAPSALNGGPTKSTSSEELQNKGVPAEEVAEVQEGESLLDDLTKREREVLRLLARGYTYREMAEKLFISVKTVETHVSNILRKTQHTNRHSLSRWVSDHNFS